MNYDAILGLPTTKTFDDLGATFNSHRRRLLRTYPRGGCSITGLLSMIKSEEVNDPTFTNYPKLWKFPDTLLRGTNPITSNAPSTGDANDGTAASGALTTASVVYIKVDSTSDMVVGSVLQIGTLTTSPQYRVSAITRGVTTPSTNGYVTANPLRAYTFGALAAATIVPVIGQSSGEGASGAGFTSSAYRLPGVVINNTQIFRHQAEFTGTALQQGTKYDSQPYYKDRMRDLCLEHAVNIERSVIYGQRSNVVRQLQDSTQGTSIHRTFGGIIEHLRLWDAGSTGLTVDGSTYAPYAHKPISTLDSDFNKRIIANSTGEFTYDNWTDWMERCFRFTVGPKNGDRMAFMGGGAMNSLVQMFRKSAYFEVSYGDEAYGFKFNTLKTQYGSLHFTDHPLFSDASSQLRNSCLIIDPQAFRLRPMTGRDTRIRDNIQNRGDDFRRDEYHSELGLEVLGVESCMLINNLQSFIVT